MRRVVGVLVALAACGGRHRASGPAYNTHVDQTLAITTPARDVAAPTERVTRPWQVGQWALYKMTIRGSVGYMRYRVIGTEACGTWFEQTIADREHQLVVKLCLPAPPVVANATQATMQVDAHPPRPLTPPPKDIPMAGAGWATAATTPSETITVRAGTFAGVVKTEERIRGIATTVWSHPAVPIAATVRTQAANGMVTELVDYGETLTPAR